MIILIRLSSSVRTYVVILWECTGGVEREEGECAGGKGVGGEMDGG